MSLPKSIQAEIEAIKNKLVKKFRPEKIILFGSYAWGKPKPDSDLDLFIVKATGNTRQIAREMDAHLYPRKLPIDLIIYRPEQVEKKVQEKDFFVKHIMENGQLLYAR